MKVTSNIDSRYTIYSVNVFKPGLTLKLTSGPTQTKSAASGQLLLEKPNQMSWRSGQSHHQTGQTCYSPPEISLKLSSITAEFMD